MAAHRICTKSTLDPTLIDATNDEVSARTGAGMGLALVKRSVLEEAGVLRKRYENFAEKVHPKENVVQPTLHAGSKERLPVRRHITVAHLGSGIAAILVSVAIPWSLWNEAPDGGFRIFLAVYAVIGIGLGALMIALGTGLNPAKHLYLRPALFAAAGLVTGVGIGTMTSSSPQNGVAWQIWLTIPLIAGLVIASTRLTKSPAD